MKISKVLLLLVAVLFSTAMAEEKLKVKPISHIFVTLHSGDLSADAIETPEWSIARLRLGVEAKVGKKFKIMGQIELDAQGDNEKVEVKDAYGTWNVLEKYFGFTLGHQKTQVFGVPEKFWGYRYINKSLADNTKMLSSRSTGLVLHSNPIDMLKINVFTYNRTKDDGIWRKKQWAVGLNVSVDFEPVLIYAAYMNQGINNVIDVLVGVEFDMVRVGLEYAGAFNYQNVEDVVVHGLSIPLTIKLPLEWLAILARYDAVFKTIDANVSAPTVESKVIVGLEFAPHKAYKIAVTWENNVAHSTGADATHELNMDVQLKF